MKEQNLYFSKTCCFFLSIITQPTEQKKNYSKREFTHELRAKHLNTAIKNTILSIQKFMRIPFIGYNFFFTFSSSSLSSNCFVLKRNQNLWLLVLLLLSLICFPMPQKMHNYFRVSLVIRMISKWNSLSSSNCAATMNVWFLWFLSHFKSFIQLAYEIDRYAITNILVTDQFRERKKKGKIYINEVRVNEQNTTKIYVCVTSFISWDLLW